jgi:hypothetical protein
MQLRQLLPISCTVTKYQTRCVLHPPTHLPPQRVKKERKREREKGRSLSDIVFIPSGVICIWYETHFDDIFQEQLIVSANLLISFLVN